MTSSGTWTTRRHKNVRHDLSTIICQTLDDLARAGGKAELLTGRVIEQTGSDFRHGRVGRWISQQLLVYELARQSGYALADGTSFVVPELSTGRESFIPEVSFTMGPQPARDRDLVFGPPTFAVEVRSDGDYGPAAERESAMTRAEYFQAGNQVVWDVDPDARTVA